MGFLMLCLPFGVAAYGLIRLIKLLRENEERALLLDDACQREMLRVAAAHGRADLARAVVVAQVQRNILQPVSGT